MNIEIITNRSGIYGGLRRLYYLATYFNEAGHNCCINIADKSKNTWFKHNVPENISINPDIRIIPEVLQERHPIAKNILYYQAHWDAPEGNYDAVITTSRFLQNTLTDELYNSQIIRYGVDSQLFKPAESIRKLKTVAYMPRKNKEEAQLIKMLAPQYDYVEIEGLNEEKVAELLQQCDVFLALSRSEGVGLPTIEAGLSGCLVIGYHGFGGLDWMTPETYIPALDTQEIILKLHETINERKYEHIRKNARKALTEMFCIEKEKQQWLQMVESFK